MTKYDQIREKWINQSGDDAQDVCLLIDLIDAMFELDRARSADAVSRMAREDKRLREPEALAALRRAFTPLLRRVDSEGVGCG